MGAYWFRSALIAAAAACLTKSGPGEIREALAEVDRLCSTASPLISVKIVVPKPLILSATGRPFIIVILPCSAGAV